MRNEIKKTDFANWVFPSINGWLCVFYFITTTTTKKLTLGEVGRNH